MVSALPTFDHATNGEGKPITLQFKDTLLPFSTVLLSNWFTDAGTEKKNEHYVLLLYKILQITNAGYTTVPKNHKLKTQALHLLNTNKVVVQNDIQFKSEVRTSRKKRSWASLRLKSFQLTWISYFKLQGPVQTSNFSWAEPNTLN